MHVVFGSLCKEMFLPIVSRKVCSSGPTHTLKGLVTVQEVGVTPKRSVKLLTSLTGCYGMAANPPN